MPASGSAGTDGSAMGLEVDVVDPTRAVSQQHACALGSCICAPAAALLVLHRALVLQCVHRKCREKAQPQLAVIMQFREVSHLAFIIGFVWGLFQSGERVLGRARQGGGPRRASDSDSDGSADGSADDAGLDAAASAAAAAPQVCHPRLSIAQKPRACQIVLCIVQCQPHHSSSGDACNGEQSCELA